MLQEQESRALGICWPVKGERENSLLDSSSVSALGAGAGPSGVWAPQKGQLWAGCDDGCSCEDTVFKGSVQFPCPDYCASRMRDVP